MLTLQYTYTIHMIILTPFGNWSSSLWNSILDLLIFMIPTLQLEWFGCPSWFYPSFLFIPPDSISWDRLLHVEAGSRDQSAQRNRGVPTRRRGSLLCSLLILDSFYHSLPYLNFEDEIFIKVGRMNIPNLNYCILISWSIYFNLQIIFINWIYYFLDCNYY